VGYATLLSTTPKASIGGVQTSKQFYKACISHPISKDDPLVRPMSYNNTGDAHAKGGVATAWPFIFVCLNSLSQDYFSAHRYNV
jgi:hypothetical protein